ncbi:hypothetical protein CI238_08840, partial [Colletotrichum incanum]
FLSAIYCSACEICPQRAHCNPHRRSCDRLKHRLLQASASIHNQAGTLICPPPCCRRPDGRIRHNPAYALHGPSRLWATVQTSLSHVHARARSPQIPSQDIAVSGRSSQAEHRIEVHERWSREAGSRVGPQPTRCGAGMV